jgi:hypothetical protein
MYYHQNLCQPYDELDVFAAVHAHAVLLRAHLAVLVDHELLRVPAGEADELEAALALVDPVELAASVRRYISLKGLLQIAQWSASYPLFISFFRNIKY